MSNDGNMTRRTILAAPIAASLISTSACAQESRTAPASNSTSLVAYFTRSGNTRVIAETLQRTLDAAIFEIQPAQPYPADYEENVEQARQERDRDYEPPLAEVVPDFATFDTVFLGFPIWGGTAPPVIRSFLSAHDLSGKTLRPFITHGGYGPGSSLDVLGDHAAGAAIVDPFILEADQERRTMNQVRGWLDENQLR